MFDGYTAILDLEFPYKRVVSLNSHGCLTRLSLGRFGYGAGVMRPSVCLVGCIASLFGRSPVRRASSSVIGPAWY